MPNLDLGPNDYRKLDARTGRWHLPADPKLARNMFFVALLILAFIFYTRGEGSRESLFGVTAMFSFFGGGLFAVWLRDRYW